MLSYAELIARRPSEITADHVDRLRILPMCGGGSADQHEAVVGAGIAPRELVARERQRVGGELWRRDRGGRADDEQVIGMRAGDFAEGAVELLRVRAELAA